MRQIIPRSISRIVCMYDVCMYVCMYVSRFISHARANVSITRIWKTMRKSDRLPSATNRGVHANLVLSSQAAQKSAVTSYIAFTRAVVKPRPYHLS